MIELLNEQLDQLFTDAQAVYGNSNSAVAEKMAASVVMLLYTQIVAYRGSLPYGSNKSYSGPA